MFETIMIPSLILLALGIVLGLILGIADKFLKVELDNRVSMVLELLPGANCGGCGFPGCSGFAEAIVEKEATVKGCPPLKADKQQAITDYLTTAEKPS